MIVQGDLPQPSRLGSREFASLCRLIEAHTGIHLTEAKLALVESRVSRRLRARGMGSFAAYLRLLEGPGADQEVPLLINAITTNKTSFFREDHHFAFLLERVLPELAERVSRGQPRRLRIWSAGCSTGEEPYSIAMTVRHGLGSLAGWDVRILASDIDTDVLTHAAEGVYSEASASGVPAQYRSRSFKAMGDGRVRVAQDLRDLITFRRINLSERSWPIRTRFDVIFCRNVLIYFDRPTRLAVYDAFSRHLSPTGYLIAGHAESLHDASAPFAPAGRTVYRHTLGDRGSLAPPRSVHRGGTGARASAAPRSRKPPSLPPRSRRAEPPRSQVSIQAGDLYAAKTPTRVRTLLGSCVAACLFDPVARVGGMNHFMLASGASEVLQPAHFGLHAMEMLINALMHLGAERQRLTAKVFGAARVLRGMRATPGVAEGNSKFVQDFLREEGIPVASQKLGGERPLLVYFETDTGRVLLRALSRDAVPRVTAGEAKYEERVARGVHPPVEDVTFF